MSELGDTLVAERRRAGKTLQEVEAATRIRGRLIEALERGEWERLPSPAYVKGYIQSYARYLEIPAEPLLELYKQESQKATPAENRVRLLDARVPKREDLHAIPMRTAVAIAAVVALLALAVWGIASLISSPRDTDTTPLPVTPEPTSTTEATGAATGTAVPGIVDSPDPATSTAGQVPVGAEFEIKVTVKKGQASWIIVRVDGLKAYEGMMTDGQSKSWLVKQEASVGMGRPTAVTVYKDDKPVTEKAQLIDKVPTFIIVAEQ